MKNIDKTQLLILLLIVITGFSIFNMNRLNTQVEQLKWQISAQENSIINQISGIEYVVNQMKEADRWYQEVESPKLDVINGDYRLSLKFKLMDYVKVSKVSFHVKHFSSDEYATYEATDIGSGIYEIQLSEFGPLHPVSKIEVDYTNSETMRLDEFGYPDYEDVLKYYISVENGETIRVSETHQLYMYDLAYSIFQPISGRIEIDDENGLIQTNLDSYQMDSDQVYYSIDRVEIQSYLDNKMVQWWKLKEMETESNWLQFMDTLEMSEEYDSLYIEVKYVGRDETNQFIQKNIIRSKR